MDVASTRELLAVASTDLFCTVIFLLGDNALNVESEREEARATGKSGKSSGGHFYSGGAYLQYGRREFGNLSSRQRAHIIDIRPPGLLA